MAEEDIGVLGESLLARTKQRNDDLYKRSKKDAYKMGLVAAGTGLIKQNLVNQTQNFLGREDIMAARARQAQGYRDAQFILQQKDEIDASGLSELEYFTKQVRPELMARANLELNESRVDPDSYGLYVQSEARKLAQQRLDAFNKALEAAQGVQSPEDFDAFAQLKTQRNATIGGWVANAARKAFGGKSQAELDQDMVDSIVNSDILEKASAVTSLRNIYSQTGDIELAIDAAALANMPEVDSAVAKVEVGDVVEVNGPWGGSMKVQLVNHYDATGSLIKQTERAIRGTLDVSASSSPELSQVSSALKEEDFTSMSENTLRVLNALPDDTREEYQEFIDQSGLGEEGQEALNKRLAAMSALYNRGASGTGADGASVGQEQSQRIMAQVLFNRMKQFQTKGGMFGWGRQVDMSKANFNDMPDSMEVALALGELDSRPSTRFNYDFKQLARMVPTLASDFGSASPEDQAGFLSVVENDPQKYSFLFTETPSGFSIYEYLLDEVQRPEQPPEAEDQVTTAEEVVPEPSEPVEPPTLPEGPSPQERVGSFFDDFMGKREEMLEEVEKSSPRRKPEEEPPAEEPTTDVNGVPLTREGVRDLRKSYERSLRSNISQERREALRKEIENLKRVEEDLRTSDRG